MGNPLIYWFTFISVLVCVILKTVFAVLEKRGIQKDFGGKILVDLFFYLFIYTVNLKRTDTKNFFFFVDLRQFYDESAGFFLVGWFFHYFPFFLMGRQLFLHHYMPALYFSILLSSVGFDLLTIRLANRKRLVAAGLFIFSVIYVYRAFIPITYGEPWTQSLCEKAKWRSTWDFDCAQ